MEKVTFMKERVIKIPGFLTSSGRAQIDSNRARIQEDSKTRTAFALLAWARRQGMVPNSMSALGLEFRGEGLGGLDQLS